MSVADSALAVSTANLFHSFQNFSVLHHCAPRRACGGGSRAEAKLHRRGCIHVDEQCGTSCGEYSWTQPLCNCTGFSWQAPQGKSPSTSSLLYFSLSLPPFLPPSLSHPSSPPSFLPLPLPSLPGCQWYSTGTGDQGQVQ